VSMTRATFKELIATNDFTRHRHPLITRIEELLDGAKLITYTASPYHPLSSILIQDIPMFEDLLRSIEPTDNGVLMINSPGGDGDVAEKMLMMCRRRFPASFRVIVPDYAKSAATMIALGSDEILMGYLSELGPIDPQFRTAAYEPGTSARSLIDGLELIRNKVAGGDPIQLYYPLLSQIRPEMIARAESAINGAREYAEKWLKQYQLKHDQKQAESVSQWLSEGKTYKSHGKVIDVSECKNVLKLNVTEIDKHSELWDKVWELYCREVFFLMQNQGQGAAKLFENEKASLVLNVAIQVALPQRQQPQRPPPFSHRACGTASSATGEPSRWGQD